jgi:hypothetical protein
MKERKKNIKQLTCATGPTCLLSLSLGPSGRGLHLLRACPRGPFSIVAAEPARASGSAFPPSLFRWQVGPGCRMLLQAHVTEPVTNRSRTATESCNPGMLTKISD